MAVLRENGYDVLTPEGAFYLWCEWPAGDRLQLWNRLPDRHVFVLTGSSVNSIDTPPRMLGRSDDWVQTTPAPGWLSTPGAG